MYINSIELIKWFNYLRVILFLIEKCTIYLLLFLIKRFYTDHFHRVQYRIIHYEKVKST